MCLSIHTYCPTVFKSLWSHYSFKTFYHFGVSHKFNKNSELSLTELKKKIMCEDPINKMDNQSRKNNLLIMFIEIS